MTLTAWILNLKLRVKLLLAFGSILIFSALLMGISFNTIRMSNKYRHVNEGIDSLKIHLLEAEQAIQFFMYEGYKASDFQQEGQTRALDEISFNLNAIQQKAFAIQATAILGNDSILVRALTDLPKVQLYFDSLTLLLKTRGFKDYGLEGELRKAIHAVEQSSYPYNKADMLTLRRHEKDFFLRKDLKYQTEFNVKIAAFEATLNTAKPSDDLQIITRLLEGYKEKFNQVVTIDTKIGLQHTDGIKGHLSMHFKNLKSSAQALRLYVKEKNVAFQDRAWIILALLFFFQIAAGIALAVVYSDQITKAIKELQRGMQSFAQGKFPPKLHVRSTEEIGKTKTAFNYLLDRIKAAQEFSGSLGQGNLDVQYADEFNQDLLAQSLIQMQLQLKEASEKQRIINWSNHGIAQLNESFKTANEDITVLGDRIIRTVVKYMNANQGAIYMAQESRGEKWAERIATYAYGKKKFVEHRVEFGSGLIGQCLLEKATIKLTQVPHNYIKITSGLGEALPRFIVIIPLLVRDEILGVVELASFEEMQKHEIEFLERIAITMANILSDKKSSADTAIRLEESQANVRQLAQQEEIIRQNAEEMQAITEQLEREKKHLESEVIRLKSLLNISETLTS